MDLYHGARDDLWPGTRELREWAETQPMTDIQLDLPEEEGFQWLGINTLHDAEGKLNVRVFDLIKVAAARKGVTEEEWKNRILHWGPRVIPEGDPLPHLAYEISVYIKTRQP